MYTCMREKTNEFFCYCEGQERKKAKMRGWCWLECRLFLRDTQRLSEEEKALRDHGSEGRRRRRKGSETGRQVWREGDIPNDKPTHL